MKTTQTRLMMMLILLFTSFTTTSGQENKKETIKQKIRQKQAEIETERVIFYTNHLKLTPGEAEKFWPLFKEYAEKQKELKKITGKKVKPLNEKPIDELTKEEANELIRMHLELKQTLFDMEKEYLSKFQTVLTIQKVAKLKETETQFKKELMKKAREKRKERIKKKQTPK